MFSFKSAGHFFATVVHDIKTGIDATTAFLTAHESQIEQAGAVATSIISAADPALAPLATSIERAGEALLGEALAAVSALSTATTQPLNITLDVDAVTELKTLFGQIKTIKGAAAVTVPATLKGTEEAAASGPVAAN